MFFRDVTSDREVFWDTGYRYGTVLAEYNISEPNPVSCALKKFYPFSVFLVHFIFENFANLRNKNCSELFTVSYIT